MKTHYNSTREFLTIDGWKEIQQKLFDSIRHHVGLHFIQMRYNELLRRKLDIQLQDALQGGLDEDGVLYCKWTTDEDEFLLICRSVYLEKPLPDRAKKNFLIAKDWQRIHKRFIAEFNCSPSISQMRGRINKLLQEQSSNR